MYPYNLPAEDTAIQEMEQAEARIPFDNRSPRPEEGPPAAGEMNRPSGPPPGRVPEKRTGALKVDAGSILGCLHRYTYIWQRNGREFWMIPTNVSRRTVSGYRWTRYGWAYTGVDLESIDSFVCV